MSKVSLTGPPLGLSGSCRPASRWSKLTVPSGRSSNSVCVEAQHVYGQSSTIVQEALCLGRMCSNNCCSACSPPEPRPLHQDDLAIPLAEGTHAPSPTLVREYQDSMYSNICCLGLFAPQSKRASCSTLSSASTLCHHHGSSRGADVSSAVCAWQSRAQSTGLDPASSFLPGLCHLLQAWMPAACVLAPMLQGLTAHMPHCVKVVHTALVFLAHLCDDGCAASS